MREPMSRGPWPARWIVASAALALCGCASSGVVPADKGSFYLSKVSAAGAYGSPDALKSDLLKEAAEHCAKQNQQFETVEFVGTPGVPFVRATSARLQFRCVASS